MSDAWDRRNKREEGFSLKAYQDHLGVWTIGWGTNLEQLVIDEDIAEYWFQLKKKEAFAAAARYQWFSFLNQARQWVIAEMIYNMGPTRFRGFGKLHQALARRDYEAAAVEMADSKWHKIDLKASPRDDELIAFMRSGVYEEN